MNLLDTARRNAMNMCVCRTKTQHILFKYEFRGLPAKMRGPLERTYVCVLSARPIDRTLQRDDGAQYNYCHANERCVCESTHIRTHDGGCAEAPSDSGTKARHSCSSGSTRFPLPSPQICETRLTAKKMLKNRCVAVAYKRNLLCLAGAPARMATKFIDQWWF